MAILDYSVKPATRNFSWRLLLISSIIGAIAGFVFSFYTWYPMLRLLSRGTQLAVIGMNEPFELWIRFAAMLVLSGAIVGGGAGVLANSPRRFFMSFLAVVGLYMLGAVGGLLYARSQWDPTGVRFVYLASAPTLTAPVAGCACVLVAVVVMIAIQFASRRGSATLNQT